MKQSKIYIYGKHAVGEALRHAPQIVRKVHLSPRMDDKALLALVRQAGVPVEPLDLRKVTSQVEGGAPHQGVVALVSLPGLLLPFDNFIKDFSPSPKTLLVFISEVQDPHNVGGILRSAAAFGAHAVLMPTHNQAPVTGAVVKASAGMAFRVPLVAVDNTQQALAQLKKKGVRICGLAAQGRTPVVEEPFVGPTLLAFGNEAEGLPAPVRTLCDALLSVPMDPRCESLNVAASAAVALYAWSLTRR